MRGKWSKLRLAGFAAMLFMAFATSANLEMDQVHAQAVGGSPHVPSASPSGRDEDGGREDDPFSRRQREKQVEARNAQRQEQLVKDTGKLLALATELKLEVDKTNKDTLSLDVIKKAEEIERLAKSVREKMRE